LPERHVRRDDADPARRRRGGRRGRRRRVRLRVRRLRRWTELPAVHLQLLRPDDAAAPDTRLISSLR